MDTEKKVKMCVYINCIIVFEGTFGEYVVSLL